MSEVAANGYPITATAFQTGGQFAIGVLASANQAVDDPSTVVTSAAALPGEAYRGFNAALDPKLNSDQRWTAFAQGLGATSQGVLIVAGGLEAKAAVGRSVERAMSLALLKVGGGSEASTQ
ncbi:MAG: hypothetical protein JST54_34390, partial [Deltaproteobacteria bacterium]|nr:hypothetical protein [Deltaproteobacteria bacterium]